MVGFGGVIASHDDDEHNENGSRRWRGRKGVRGECHDLKEPADALNQH